MNQIRLGFKLFFQSIIFTFKHAQLFLYIGAYIILHHLLNYLLFPSLTIDIQNLADTLTIAGNYTPGITSSPMLLILLGIIFHIFSFLFFYVLIVGITDYTSHLLHNQSETIMHSIKKGLSKIGAIIVYGFLKITFIFFGILVSAPILRPLVMSLANNPENVLSIRLIMAALLSAIIYFIYEAFTFYFFPAITLSNASFFEALKKSWHMVFKTFFTIIVFLILWGVLAAVSSVFIPVFEGFMLGKTIIIVLASIFSYTIFTVFKTILYEKVNGTLPKRYDQE
ncbi:MAG: hypothetical protein M1114_00035 [Candidatus Dependentiae bacterium]|nr:hypothetical protein [Candidatus Dependentiae bacterium]